MNASTHPLPHPSPGRARPASRRTGREALVRPRSRLAATAIAIALGSAATVGLTSGVAAAGTPVETGCPAGYQTLTLEFLASQGPYVLPFTLDEAGNGDGVICGKPFNAVAYEKLCSPCPVPVLYQFLDNDLTPAH